jgi:predicted nucleic acid binding AN1-type Zn finger protein
MKTKSEVIEEMQKVVEQMRLDDIEENPDIVNDFFDCACCGQYKDLAGSIQYGDYRLCNDCVLFAEVGFELKKFNSIQDLVDAMEDKRLEEICGFIKSESIQENN